MYQFIHPFGNNGILTSAGLDLAEGVKPQAELKLCSPVSHCFLLEMSKGFPMVQLFASVHITPQYRPILNPECKNAGRLCFALN